VQRFAGSVCTGNGNRTPSARSDGGATWSAPVTLAGPMKLTDLANRATACWWGLRLHLVRRQEGGADPRRGQAEERLGVRHMYASKVKVPALAKSYPLRMVDEPVLSTQGDRSQPTRPLIIQ
jgi:hypothetical protein